MGTILTIEEKAVLVTTFCKEKEKLNNQARDLAKEMELVIETFHNKMAEINKKQHEVIQKQIGMDIALEDSFNPSLAGACYGRNIFNIRG